ncbi:MAG: ABC transporter ATP-binding protein [Planctomycetia bacterium]|nr:ABC transporter ATP-binding protein [Planctomycetia bacterium]
MVGIELHDVGLTFRVRPYGKVGLKEYMVQRLFRKALQPRLKVRALDGINLRLREGERLGILGPNGAGKSTLLKLMAGIYPPTRGCRVVHGRISSLFDIALGFEPEANGWDNIAYRGYFQGESPRSVRAKLDAIAEFSELGERLDMPVRYYSAGMKVRLAFAIATAIDPEILLIDEVLSVGDRAFQKKARQRMKDMMARARLLVLVSHDLDSLRQMCSRVIWMEQGRVRREGCPDEVIGAYIDHVEGAGPATPLAAAATA